MCGTDVVAKHCQEVIRIYVVFVGACGGRGGRTHTCDLGGSCAASVVLWKLPELVIKYI